MKEELKAWCQRHHCEALAQLAVFAPAREALQRDASVVPALEAVAAAGLSADIREVAAAALMALSDKELQVQTEGQKHVMLSCALSGGILLHCVSSILSRYIYLGRYIGVLDLKHEFSNQFTAGCCFWTLRASRPVGRAGYDQTAQRESNRSRLRHVV